MPCGDESKFQQLLNLLVKIEKSPRHIGLEICWNGKKWKWRAIVGGLDASEWIPHDQLPPRNMREG